MVVPVLVALGRGRPLFVKKLFLWDGSAPSGAPGAKEHPPEFVGKVKARGPGGRRRGHRYSERREGEFNEAA